MNFKTFYIKYFYQIEYNIIKYNLIKCKLSFIPVILYSEYNVL